MKKILSITLAAIMMLSLIVPASAAGNWEAGTNVVYAGAGAEVWTVTVPASLNPGQSGNVVVDGQYASNRELLVYAQPSVTLVNSINPNDTKTLDVTFNGIELLGSNTGNVTATERVSVASITDALFGTWNGHFSYSVEMTTVGLIHNTIADGAVYGNFATGQVYDAMPATVSEDDVYLYGDYGYQYNSELGGWEVALATTEVGIQNYLPQYPLTDRNKTSYGEIISVINDKPVKGVSDLFFNCTNLVESPVLPTTVTKMIRAFYHCESMTTAPVIPTGVTEMLSAFECCYSLATYHGSQDTNGDFSNYKMPIGVTDCTDAFEQCYKMTYAPAMPEAVTNMSGTFQGCIRLKRAPVIPSGVVCLHETFVDCRELTGEVVINTNHITNILHGDDYETKEEIQAEFNAGWCFHGVDMSNITLTGDASEEVLNMLGSTGDFYTP